ncbi:hemagglutinin repeat-containing protein [Vibrio brasiliensis]|nr:hemagglutinin repeat-containing protein [Vibrio brasiliensis]
MKGATVAANDSLTVDVGGDLNVASVQDRHSSSQKGMGISGGLSLSGGQTADGNGALPEGTLNSLKGAGNLTGASGGFNTSNGRTRAKQTVLTSLNSGGSADITVANNTDVKGALIATTDENGQDSEKLNLTTGTLTYADLSNTSYNQNGSMGLNTSVGVNDSELDSTNNSTSVQYKNTSGYSKSKTLATIGQGQLTIADSENSDSTTSLNRDTEHTDKDLFTVDRKQGDIDVTVDHRVLTEDGRKAIAKDVETTHEAGQDVYRAAETYVNSDNMDLFDFGKSVSDNRKVTELKNELLSSQEGLDLLNDLKSTDPDKVLAAQAEISKKSQEKYGLEPEQVNFYDADKTTSIAMQDNDVRDVHGGVVTDDDHEMHGEVNVDVSDAITKTELLNTLGHETYESITENTTGEQTAAQEDLAKSFGNQLEDRVNQAAGGDLDSTVGDNWNSSLVNSSTTQLGTERVNKVGSANVDYYLTQTEAQRKVELKRFIERCTDSSCRNTDEYKSKQKELASIIKKDDQIDLDYKKACYSGGGDECNNESAKVVAAHDTWDKETAVKDSSLTSEYIDITSKNAEAEARPWELAAGSALAEMPTDALIGSISAVPEMVDLATTATAAIQGDEGAQQQLKTMYESAVETMSDPNGAADKYIADIQAKEASGEISPHEAKKQISKFYISVAAAATGSAHGVVKLGDTSLNAIAKAGDSVTDIVKSKPHKTSSANDTQEANIERAPGSTDSEAGLNSPLISSNSIFDAKGVDPTAPAVQNVRTDLYKEYKAAGVSDELAKSLADGNIKSGSTIPTKRTAKQGETLFKFVPSGNAPGRSSYYFTRTEYEYFKSNPDKLAQEAGLPYKNFVGNYDVYAIEPKPDVNPVVFESKVAEVQEGAYRAQGGANQTLVPNLKNWETPKKVDGLKVYGND